MPHHLKPPKRAPSARNLFLKSEVTSGKYGQLNPSTIGDVSKQVASSWQNLSDSERAVYQGQAQVLGEQHRKALIKWFAETPVAVRREWARRRKAAGKNILHRPRDPNAPKYHRSGWSLCVSRALLLPPS